MRPVDQRSGVLADELGCAQWSAMDRIQAVRKGLPVAWLQHVARALGWDVGLLSQSLQISSRSRTKPQASSVRLRTDESERLLLLTDLAADVKQMVMRSGRAEGFDAGRWLGGWLQQPCPALAGAYPAEYLDTMEGCRLIRSLLSKMETGVYA